MNDSENDKTAEQKLDQVLASLAREQQPEHDLWPGIAAQIAPARESSRFSPWLQVATVAALAVSVAMNVLMWQQSPTASGAQLANQTASTSPGGLMNTAYLDDQQLQRQLTTGDLMIIRENLLLVQSALQQIDSILVGQPNNPELLKQRDHLAGQQMRLLNKINTLTL